MADYVKLEVKVFYDPVTDRIHLAHNGEDELSLSTDVARGTPMERHFVRVLEHFGKPTGGAGDRAHTFGRPPHGSHLPFRQE